MPHYEKRNLSDSFMTECYLEISDVLVNETEYLYSNGASMFGGIVGIVTGIIGFGLNFLVIIAFTKLSTFRTEYLTPFLISLALTDCLSSAIALPMDAIIYLTGDWPFGQGLCKFFPVPYYGLIMCQWWNLAAISAIRCIGVHFPGKVKENNFRHGAKLLIVMAWVLSFLPMISTLTETWGRHGLECRTRRCGIINLHGEAHPRIVIGNMTVLLTLLLMVVFNVSIYVKLRHHSQKLRTSMARDSLATISKAMEKKERRFGKMITILTTLFIITYLPIATMTMVVGPHAPKKFPTLSVVLLKFAHLSVIIDPLVYIIYHKKYRRAIKMVTKNIFNCRTTPEIIVEDSTMTPFRTKQSFNNNAAIEDFKRARLST